MPVHPSKRSNADSSCDVSRPAVWKMIAAAMWIVGFLWIFFSQALPNNSTTENPVSRVDIWAAIQSDPLSLLNPLDYSWSDQRASWSNLDQRTPHCLTALMIWSSAWGWGHFARVFLVNPFRLTKSERLVVDGGIGLSLISLWVLLLGIQGQLNASILLAPGYILAAAAFVPSLPGRRTQQSQTAESPAARTTIMFADWLLIIGIVVFGFHLFLGTFTPAWDFDVREYHLQGPKEWWQAGHIVALYHNVYTSFPFLSEMLSLLAMSIDGDPWQGAISGKAAIAAFSYLSILAVFAISSRLFGLRSGLLAALILISTPWLLRISIIAYAESAITFYLIATVMVALRLRHCQSTTEEYGLTAIAGFLAGSAMSSKYPGVVSVVIPIGCFVVWNTLRSGGNYEDAGDRGGKKTPSRSVRIIATYGFTTLLAVSPWLIRNVSDTGNPVYPLVWSVFGGADWDASLNAKWKAAHSAPSHNLSAIPQHVKDVALKNDWQSGLLFSLAIPAAALMFRRQEVKWMSLHTVWLLGSWWLLTHRIDRFWVPMIPLLAVIASGSCHLSASRAWQAFLLSTVLVTSIFNYAFSRLDVIGFHIGLSDLPAAGEKRVRDDIRYLNAALPQGSRVLMVGEAEVFDCRFETVYNTVFDKSLFQEWTCAVPDVIAGTENSASLPMLTADEIHARLVSEGVTHLYVNWLEILRYRLTYGYTPYVTPDRFQQLVADAVLRPGTVTSMGSWQTMPKQERDEVRSWKGNEFLQQAGDGWSSRVLYRVNSNFKTTLQR